MRQIVIGAGEVGQALAKVLECEVYDVHDTRQVDGGLDVLHIAFPWQIGNFVEEVERYVGLYEPNYVVVHSTVPPETCDRREWVHSPVRGKHPNLEDGLRTFVKHYGGWHAPVVAPLLKPWFPFYAKHEFAATTETAKLWELVQYGVEISMQKLIYAYCARMDLDPEEVYNLFGHTYNEGWIDSGHEEYVKPVLTDVPGPIGGHCVVQGAKMLNDHHPHVLTQLVLMVQNQLEGK